MPIATPIHLNVQSSRPAALSPDWIALALMVPIFVSGVFFNTYDLALASLSAEMARQFNLPFLLAEAAVIAVALSRGFRPNTIWGFLNRSERGALTAFLAVYWIGGVIHSEAAGFATLFSLTYLIHPIFAFAVAHCVSAPGDRGTEAFAKVITLALLFFAVAIAIQFARPPAGRAVTDIEWQFALPGFISVRLFGAMIAPFLVLVTWLALRQWEDSGARWWILGACALLAGMLVWSGTRAAVAGFGAAALIALVVFRLKLQARSLFLTCAALGVGAVGGYLLVPYGDSSFYLFVPADAEGGADGLAGGRLSFWMAIWEAYLPVKWFGAGPGASAWILPPEHWPHIQPHNVVLQFLLSWGLIASLAAVYLLGRLIISLHARALAVPAAISFVLMFDCLAVMSLFDGTLHFAQHVMMAAAAAGLAFARAENGSLGRGGAGVR